jgi:hypothetical protein
MNENVGADAIRPYIFGFNGRKWAGHCGAHLWFASVRNSACAIQRAQFSVRNSALASQRLAPRAHFYQQNQAFNSSANSAGVYGLI